VDASISASANIVQSKISGLTAALDAKLTNSDSPLIVNATAPFEPGVVLQLTAATKWALTLDSSNSQFQLTRGTGFTPVMTAEQSSGNAAFAGDLSVTGAIRNPGRSYIFAQVTNSQSIGSGVTYGILYNSFSLVGSAISYNATNGRFTVSAAGLYTVEAVCRLANYSASQRSVMQILKNGGSVWEADSVIGIQIVATLLLAANDYVQIAVYNGGASTTTLNTGTVSSATMRFVG
jgi:hypothetical protein